MTILSLLGLWEGKVKEKINLKHRMELTLKHRMEGHLENYLLLLLVRKGIKPFLEYFCLLS